jgi:hypothetical protein
VGPHQVRLDIGALGEGWREGLVRALAALSTSLEREEEPRAVAGG